MKKAERDDIKKAIMCMEFLARHINAEGIFEGWLMCGVPDGDIEYGNLDPDTLDDDIVEDIGSFTGCFLRAMKRACDCGGLCFGTKAYDGKVL